ncbi:bifunctional methylenetetrahydrofolate dehydrogenase/methenyltetrahydrofolate cyclohydrolase FolD [Siminovitchia fortis]|uniref:Bifunctional protein FolD n=1 Tax=Siminovitchia fortis TaxID=254758 RepID=A0A443J3N2_9BACI|nr:bifunctional methylenetetrahydrofolate dehydrogenase/methenyltetrahydrofolate cyclohydrolase FolD [Siminovitchia fortis]RWR15084.1 bifunctional methylenetetrahydrofolate dehydrogenase/methenyltetrahydrofolate cyclohydrolase FolD [Siminovitchia fortis]WHY82778.1 bifunctional methylenetetrahydrofolate dehydrogenase/methenyltetrahydrofolate cyclohydrolase FolD [Siminovitchia fortis]
MTAELIDGKKISQEIRKGLEKEVAELTAKGMKPGLAVILVGDNPASRTYVTSKQKSCRAIGMESVLIEYPADVSEKELLDKITELNADDSIHGILVQLPIPPHISETKVIETISPEKDVDGFHPINIGKMMTGQDTFLPCTPFGVMEMLKYIGINPEGKHAVIIGRSNIVGKPMGQLLLNENATVTYCHSRTSDLQSFTKQADILVAAVGRAKMVKAEHIKQGAVIIDVGMNKDEHGKLCGDVDFEDVKDKAAYLTPVPGGVGPMTITMLLYNTVKSAQNRLNDRNGN